MINPHKKPDELSILLRSCSRYFATAAIFSGAINLLYLAGPLYMLQVYDRVISSASEVTLVMLTVALLVAYIAQQASVAPEASFCATSILSANLSPAPASMPSSICRGRRSIFW